MIVKPPTRKFSRSPYSVFLAGSIEMGQCDDWQTYVGKALDGPNRCIYNPRRDHWDASWEQSIDNPKFVEQVEWELDMLDESYLKLFYFHPATKAPITLMELGIAGKTIEVENSDLNNLMGSRSIVCCPKGFWRKGNVDVVCKRFNLPQVPTLDDLISEAKKHL